MSIKFELNKSYKTNTGKVLTLWYVINRQAKLTFVMVHNDEIYGLFNIKGENLQNDNMDEYEIITGEFIEQPKWDWNLCKFAKYIFRQDDKTWYVTDSKPAYVHNGSRWIWYSTYCFRIPEEFAPIYSGSDENSLMKRP